MAFFGYGDDLKREPAVAQQPARFRLETHSRSYAHIAEADETLVAALLSTKRLAGLEAMFDDWSDGVQPVEVTEKFAVPIETAQNVYRRIRTITLQM